MRVYCPGNAMLSSILDSISRHKANLLAILAGQGLAIVGAAVGTRVLTESASTATFGEAKLVIGLVVFPMALVLRPVAQFCMRVFHDAEVSGSTGRFLSFARRLQFRVGLRSGLAFLAGLLVYRYFQGSPTIAIAVAGAVMVVGEALLGIERGLRVTMNRQFSASVLATLQQGVLPFVAAAAMFLIADSAMIFVASQAIALCLFAAGSRIQLPALRDSSDAQPEEDARWKREAASFVIPLAYMGLFSWILNVGDRYILAYSVSMDDIGRYAAVYGLVATPMAALVMMTSRFLTPMTYQSAARKDEARRRSLRLRMTAVGFGIALTALVFIWLFGEIAVNLLLAEEYRQGATQLMLWLVAGNGFLVIAAAYEVEAMARKTTKVLTISMGVGATANVLTNLALIPSHGTLGAAIATFVGYGLHALTLATLLGWRRRNLRESS